MHYVLAIISMHRCAILCIRARNHQKMISMQLYALRISGGGLLGDASAGGSPIGTDKCDECEECGLETLISQR